MSLPRWGGIIAGEAVGLGGLRAVMMLLASIKSLQAAESISPVVKLHLTQGVAFLQAAVSELCMCVCFLCVCDCVILEWECMNHVLADVATPS